MGKRKVEELSISEFLKKVDRLKPGRILRVRFENVVNSMSVHPSWQIDVRKTRDKGDGLIHLYFSTFDEHPNGDGDSVAEAAFCYGRHVKIEKLCEFASKKEPLSLDEDSDYDENVRDYLEAVKSLAGIENDYNRHRDVEKFEWYDRWSDYQQDYGVYLKTSHSYDFEECVELSKILFVLSINDDILGSLLLATDWPFELDGFMDIKMAGQGVFYIKKELSGITKKQCDEFAAKLCELLKQTKESRFIGFLDRSSSNGGAQNKKYVYKFDGEELSCEKTDEIPDIIGKL